MKTYKLMKFVVTGLLMIFMFFGCTDDFEELNTNERVLTELDAALLGNIFARVQHRGFWTTSPQIAQNLFADHFAQYYANTQTKFPSDRYNLVGGWLNGAWRQFYGDIAGNLGVVLEGTDPVENPGFETFYAVAQIYRVVIYEHVTNYWGPIPYSQTNNGESAVPYDSEKDIYMSFFTTLDEALAILNQNKGGNAFGANDQIYGGDIDKWIIFANTIRLRIAMRISSVEPQIAKDQAEKAVQDGVMEEVDDDALFHPTVNSRNGMNRMVPWNEFRMSATMESVLKGYNDPRMPQFFSPTRQSSDPGYADYNGGPPTWIGLRNGYEINDLSKPELATNNLSPLGPRWDEVAKEAVNPHEHLQSSEAYFIRAEGALKGWNMGGTPEELYNLGIEKSMQYWGIDAADIAAYQQSGNVPIATHDAPNPVSDVPVKFDAGRAMEQIMTQKWLGLFPNGWEAWADLRRTDLPAMYDRMASENPDVAANEIMRRVEFVSGEYETNADAVADGVSKLGGPDKGSTRLWWNPAP